MIQLVEHILNKKNNRDNRYIRCSGIGDCSRALGYQLLGYEGTPNNIRDTFTLDLGNCIHDMVQNYLVEMGWVDSERHIVNNRIEWTLGKDGISGCEIPIIDHNLKIIGHCDGVTVPLIKENDRYIPNENGERYLIEIKSITDRPNFWVMGVEDDEEDNTYYVKAGEEKFFRIDYEKSNDKLAQNYSKMVGQREVNIYGKKHIKPVYELMINGNIKRVIALYTKNTAGGFTSLKEPKKKHILQASLYGHLLGIKKILFIYVAKDHDPDYDNLDLTKTPIKLYEHTIKQDTIDFIINKVDNIYYHVDNGVLPPREFSPDDKKSDCKFCSFAWQCYPNTVNVDRINRELNNIGKPDLRPGPHVVHEYKNSLSEEYKNKEVI